MTTDNQDRALQALQHVEKQIQSLRKEALGRDGVDPHRFYTNFMKIQQTLQVAEEAAWEDWMKRRAGDPDPAPEPEVARPARAAFDD